jgi:hemerythrin-like domain-containing protein
LRQHAQVHEKRATAKAKLQNSAHWFHTTEMDHVIKVIKGVVFQPERYELDRSEIRKVLDRIIAYCDKVEDALEGIAYSHYKKKKVSIPKRERLNEALRIAHRGLYRIFETDSQKAKRFTVMVWVNRGWPDDRERWKRNVLPPAAQQVL